SKQSVTGSNPVQRATLIFPGSLLRAFFLNVSQFRRLTVVWFAGSLLKETGMVNPPVRRGNQRVGIWDNRGFRCWY
ncbi:hypothetical protein DNX01_23760, partial [Shigella flexneri]|nr:hypothetical protein [Shigella flexneri]